MNNYQSFLQLLQLSSPTLPLGAYSYSEGLEYLVVNNIKNQEQLLEWLRQELTYGAIRIESAIMLRSVANFPDLAPYVGADLQVMEKDSNKMRIDKPFVFTNLKEKIGLDQIINFIELYLS